MDDAAAFIMNFSYLWFCVLAHRYVSFFFFFLTCLAIRKKKKIILSFQTAADLEREKKSILCSREIFVNGLQTRTMSCPCSCVVWSFTAKQTEYFSSDLVYFSSQNALVNPYVRCIVAAKQVLSWRDGFGPVRRWLWRCLVNLRGCKTESSDKGVQNAAQIPL